MLNGYSAAKSDIISLRTGNGLLAGNIELATVVLLMLFRVELFRFAVKEIPRFNVTKELVNQAVKLFCHLVLQL